MTPYLRTTRAAGLALASAFIVVPALAATPGAHDSSTQTPIQHVIVVVGSGHSLDDMFATYVPPTGTVSNLLAKGIVTREGTLGTQAAALYDAAPAAGVINMQKGDLPYLKALADQYMLADNYHQAVTTGRFANSMMLAYADAGIAKAGDDMPAHPASILSALTQAGVSFAYYGEGWNPSLASQSASYCADCNPFQYDAAIMTDPAVRDRVLHDTDALDADIRDNAMPAVAYVRPGLNDDGRDNVAAFEAFTRRIVHAVQVNRKLWATSAILVTMDDGGDSYDAGYVQPLDPAGDGPRVPLLIVSPYTINVGVRHNYADHASVVKFIEANWGLRPIRAHGRDALPNPIVTVRHPYVPTNIPAIGNLMDFFNFPQTD